MHYTQGNMLTCNQDIVITSFQTINKKISLILGLLAVIVHSQSSVTHRILFPISIIPNDDVFIFDPHACDIKEKYG